MTRVVIRINLPDLVTLAFFVTMGISCGTSNQISSQKIISHRQNDSVLVDKDGNRYTIKRFPDNNLWTTINLNTAISNSYCYGDSGVNFQLYGRLYTWESAQKGCSLLGEGWRLPTKNEWQRLAGLYSDSTKDSVENRKSAYQALLLTGTAQFNALLGGGRAPDGEYARLEAHGFYWTTTENDSSAAWFINFAKGSQALYYQTDGEKTRAFSVRCIKGVDNSK